jgi:hypothetical protein
MSDVDALDISPPRDADLPALEAYLAARSETCMLLRANLRAAGLAWAAPGGGPVQFNTSWRGAPAS